MHRMGVHHDSGKSYTCCATVLGDARVLDARSTKDKIVTASSTKAEVVSLYDSDAQAIYLRNVIVK